MQRKLKVLFLTPYPLYVAPSQRFRVEIFFPHLLKSNIAFKISPFLDESTFAILYSNSSRLKKTLGVFKGFLKRLATVLWLAPFYHYIFIHREASPIGPPIFEFILAKVLRKKIIYDFDDAIWIPDSDSKILNSLKAHWKIKWICQWAYKVVVGNDFLGRYAKRFNKNVVSIPTCVDTERHHNKIKNQTEVPITIGWTGSHSTLKFLDPIVPVLNKVATTFNVNVLIICNRPPTFSLSRLQFIPWKEATEIEDLLKINIGIMPLLPDAWSEGKCGFKLIQYLSLGITAIASPIGVNKDIIDHGINGYLCNSEQEWYEALVYLIENTKEREKMGLNGRKKIVSSYSVQTYAPSFIGLFK